MNLSKIGSSPSPVTGGSAMLLAVVVLTALMGLLFSYMSLTVRQSRTAVAQEDDQHAFYLAEAALSEVTAAIQGGGTGNIGTQATPARLGGGLFWAEATDLGNDLTQVEITAMNGTGRHALEVVLRTSSGASSMFPAMILSNDRLSIDSNQLVDSYDSSLGTYASQATNSLGGTTYANDNGDVRSNSDVIISSNTKVMGSAIPGPSSSVSLDSGVVVTGTTTPATTTLPLTTIPLPSGSASGNYTVSGTKTLGPGYAGYGSVKVKDNAHLVLVGPADIVVKGKLETGENSTIEIDATNGPVTIFNVGTFKYNEKTTLTVSTGSPADVAWVFYSANTISFPGGIDFLGGIYAPKASIKIDSNSEFWGAVVCDELTMSSGTKFHYDEFLASRTVQTGGGGGALEIVTWRSVPVEEDALRVNRGDPFNLLGVNAANLPAPANAWDL